MADISDKAKKPSNDKQKPIRKSTRLQERVAQQSEPLDVGAPTSMDYNGVPLGKTHQSFETETAEKGSNIILGENQDIRHHRITELKSIIQIEVEGNPRDEVRYFEDMCQSFKLFDLESRYQVLTSVWRPHRDIRNYFTAIDYDRRDYQSLVDYLSNRDGNVGRVFQPKPEFSSLNGQTLELEVKKWEDEMKDSDTLKKFLYVHLAPEHIEGKIREFLYLDIDKFKLRCRNICYADQQRKNRAAKNISYTGNRFNQRQSKSDYNPNTKDKMHHVIDCHQNQNIFPHDDNEKTVKHCSVAIAKTASVSSRRTFKPKASRKIISYGITGRVVWFNVHKGYGFIHRDDKDSDIFVHHTNITKNNPNKLLRSLAQGEVVQFDVVMGIKNLPQAVNVTGPNNKPVKGYKYSQDRWPSYNQMFNRQQKPQQKCYLVKDYCKLRDKQQREKQNNYKKKHNHKPNYQFKTTNVRPLSKENSQIDASNRITKFNSTCYKPIKNEIEVIEPQREIMILHLKQDELIKEGLNIEQNVENIRLKIKELTNKVVERLI